MAHLPARVALLCGNFIVGVAILGIAAMLQDLAVGLGVTVQSAGLLVTFGGVVLGTSPLMVWLTSRWDRRLLLAGVLGVLAIGQIASAFAPDYSALLVLRLLMMAVAAIYTPVAASTAAMLVPEAARARAIVFVFLGFSLAVAAGLPLVTFLSAHLGWRTTFAILGACAALSGALLVVSVPSGLRGAPLSLASWTALARNPFVLSLLLLTLLQVSGQFIVITYLAPLSTELAGASVAVIGTFFLLFGVAGFAGNVVATRWVQTLGSFRTSVISLVSLLFGILLWALGAGSIPAMGAGMVFWGLGFAAVNSMQQARLVAAAPALASASVSLNTATIYLGQAVGSGIGAVLFAHGLHRTMGHVALVFPILALLTLALSRRLEQGSEMAR